MTRGRVRFQSIHLHGGLEVRDPNHCVDTALQDQNEKEEERMCVWSVDMIEDKRLERQKFKKIEK